MREFPSSPDPIEAAALSRLHRRVGRGLRILATLDTGDRPEVTDEPVIFAANHRSMADLFLATATFSNWGWPIRPLVAGSYFKKPGIGGLLRRLRCIPVHGSEALDIAAEVMAEGWSVAIMPEGRVVPESEWGATGVGTARPGIGRLALATGRPVVAVGVSGTDRFWPRGSNLPRIRPWRRFPLAVRYEVLGVMEGDQPSVTLDEIMAGITRCLNATGSSTGGPAPTD